MDTHRAAAAAARATAGAVSEEANYNGAAGDIALKSIHTTEFGAGADTSSCGRALHPSPTFQLHLSRLLAPLCKLKISTKPQTPPNSFNKK